MSDTAPPSNLVLPDGRSHSGIKFYARVLAYFRADRRLLAGLVVFIWLSLFAGVMEPAAVAALTDRVLPGTTDHGLAGRFLEAVLPGSRLGQIIALAFGWLLLRACNDAATLLREMLNNQLQFNGTARVRSELFDHLQQLGPHYHKSHPQGDTIYRLGLDTLGFFGILNTFVGAANSILTLLVISAVMLGWNVRITLVALALAPLLVIANTYFGRTIRRTSAVSKQADSDLTTFIQRSIGSMGLVQLFGRQPLESRRFCATIDRTIQAGMKMNWQVQLYPLAQRLIYAIGYAFVLGYGGYLVYRGETSAAAGSFTIGGIFAMTFYLGQLWEPLRRITGFTADVQNNAAACARVFQVVDLAPRVVDSPAARALPVRPRTLELENVCFGYDRHRAILRGITARIEPGEMVAFVGASGAGKSTLLNLLPRFYDPTKGGLFLDSHDLRTLRVADARRHIALVPQESPIVAGTIAQNIAFGDPDASPGRIHEAAELAGASNFIEELPEGYNTELSECGQNLSGGQRQRLAIARALLTEAPILVLDEPTSGLDRHHENLFLQTLRQLKGRRTIILVTHSLNAVADCDRIYFLHQGQIAEQGTRDQLLNCGGLFAAMADMPHLAPRHSESPSLKFPPTLPSAHAAS